MVKRYYFMDLLAIVSSFAVVMLHTSGNATYLGVMVNRFTADGTWSVLTNILFAFAVPVFFIQSGAKVSNYRDRYDTKSFFTKRVSKVAVPFVFWSVLAYFLFGKWQSAPLLKSFLAENIVGPYWFFYYILAFYLCVPALSVLVKYRSDRLIVLFKGTLPLLAVVFGYKMPFVSALPFGGGYLQYFLVGWYVSNHDLTSATRRKIYLLGLLMLALEIGLTLGLSYRTPRLPYYNYSMGYIKNFYDIANFPEFCLVLALFTWMKEKESKIRAWSFKDRLPLLAGITFGIYLLHPFVIYHFLPVMKKYLGASPVYIRYFAYPLAIYLISAALTVLLRKILGVKYVLT